MEKVFLIFITKDKLLAYDVGRNDYIGLDGNDFLEYHNSADIEQFRDCIVDNFNEDSFADLAAMVTIINCGANLLYVDKLYNVLEGCREKNVLNVERILPLIAFNNGLKKNEEMTYEVVNQYYLLKRNDANGINCSLTVENDSTKELLPADFEFLFDFVGVNHWDEEKEKSLAEYKGKFKKLEEEYKKLKIDNFNSQKPKLVEEMATILKNQSITCEDTTFEDKRMMFKPIKDLKIGQEVTRVSMKTDGFNSFIVKFNVGDGDIVAKHQCVAKFYKQNNLYPAEAVLFAPFAGRFYSILKRGCAKGDAVRYDSYGSFIDIGIFANLNCSREDAYLACNFVLY